MRKIRFERYHFNSNRPSPGGSPWAGLLLIKWLILTAAVMFTAYVMDNIHVTGFVSAFFAAAAIGILNLFFRPILLILTLPINILSLGLFTFIINALMLKMASGLIPGFSVIGFWSTVFGAILISIINWLLSSLVADAGPPKRGKRPDADHIDMRKKGDRWE